MRLITPAGKQDFDWSPKEKSLSKTASTSTPEKTDKDFLYEAAQKVVKAQMALDMEETAVDGAPCCGDAAVGGIAGDSAAIPPPSSEEAAAIPVADEKAEGGKSDAVAAVQELADKAQKAEEVAGKVQEAVEKVEEAVQGVKDAVGVAADEVVLDVEVDDEAEGEDAADEIEIEIEDDDSDKKDEKDDEGEKDDEVEENEDDIVQKSCNAATKKAKMNTAANDPDDLAKFSKISPTTRKKVLTFYKDYLGYDPEYCKLLVTDYEK